MTLLRSVCESVNGVRVGSSAFRRAVCRAKTRLKAELPTRTANFPVHAIANRSSIKNRVAGLTGALVFAVFALLIQMAFWPRHAGAQGNNALVVVSAASYRPELASE